MSFWRRVKKVGKKIWDGFRKMPASHGAEVMGEGDALNKIGLTKDNTGKKE